MQHVRQLVLINVFEVPGETNDLNDGWKHKLCGKEVLDLREVRASIFGQVKHFKGGPNGLIIATRWPTSDIMHIFAELEIDFVVAKIKLLQVAKLAQSVDFVYILDLIVG